MDFAPADSDLRARCIVRAPSLPRLRAGIHVPHPPASLPPLPLFRSPPPADVSADSDSSLAEALHHLLRPALVLLNPALA